MADTSVAITAGSGTPIRVLSGLGAGSADQQVMTLADSYGNLLGTSAAAVPTSNGYLNVTGSLAALNATVDGVTTLGQYAQVRLQITGTYSGTVSFQVSNDGSNWFTKYIINNASLTVASSTGSTGTWYGDLGAQYFRVNMTAFTSGTATITLQYTQAPAPISLAAVSIQSGSNTIGSIASISTSIVPGTAATNLGKAAAAAPSTTDTGMAPLYVRKPSTPAAMTATAGNYSQGVVDQEGKLIIQQYADPTNTWQSSLTLTSTTSTAMNAAQSGSLRNYCTGITVSNASTTATTVKILDGGTTIWQANFPASGAPFFVAFETPLRGTAATAMNAQLGAAVTSVYVSAQGFIGV